MEDYRLLSIVWSLIKLGLWVFIVSEYTFSVTFTKKLCKEICHMRKLWKPEVET